MRASELNSFGSIRAIRGRSWLAATLILLLGPNAFAQSDFSAFWKKFSSAVIAGEKATVAEMTKFPLSMPYGVKAVKDKEDFLRRYNEIFKGEANATQSFRSLKTLQKFSSVHAEVHNQFNQERHLVTPPGLQQRRARAQAAWRALAA